MFSKFTLLLTAASMVAAETKYLVVQSDDKSVDGSTLGFIHEGAGINYGFAGSAEKSEPLDYDEKTQLLTTTATGITQVFSVDSKYVATTVAGSTKKFSFDDESKLLVDGSSAGFYLCKNTGDPYNYSQSSYELMYYTSDSPSDCITITLVDSQKTIEPIYSNSSISVTVPTSSTTVPTTLTQSSTTSTASSQGASISSYTGGAAIGAPIAGAALFGIVAALV
ncbi:hypothetical protein DAMA08_011800 [Martiniozyma asiatica (nom. inval.)]|nr:hypothetical protein DAMA08_011800 [Martiniozyma asiatica]